MYISDIARKLRIRDKDLRQKLKGMGYNFKPRVRTLDDATAREIISKLEDTKEPAKKEEETLPTVSEVEIPETVTVGEFAEKTGKPASEVIQDLMKNGIMAAINQEIDFDTATLLAEGYGITVKKFVDEQVQDREKGIRQKIKDEVEKSGGKSVKMRSPVVTVMGHVDHGKTTLLDAIRDTNVTSSESGGITQHIGAYQVKEKGRVITFLDTPGHEAFSAMRARGARVTDIAILLVAADDGVKPQTKEALDLIKKEKVPFIVAINKIDKPGANIERVKKELGDLEVVPEDWGGDTVMVEVSAKKKLNIDNLLEMILLVADVEELKAEFDVPAVGTIIEQHKDARRGATATVLVQNGTLKVGDFVTVGGVMGTIRSMENYQGKKVDHAKPSTPVQILGLESLPAVGDILHVEEDKAKAKEKINRLKKKAKSSKRKVDDSGKEIKKLNILIKADVQGSLEAILGSLDKIESDRVAIDVVDYGVGKITESDIMLVSSSNAKVYLFRTAPTSIARVLARDKKIILNEYSVIYELIDAIKTALTELIEPEVVEKTIGSLEILKIFRTEKGKMIIGGKVVKGKIIKDSRVVVTRGEEELGDGSISNIQRGQSPVDTVAQGEECGMKYEGKVRIKTGDILTIIERKVIKHTIN
ncbi:translation initiation factor IF-2 [Patescibacteria group bacterium]|nr:translation initiation factor IF-2 [Patescibacteria group bacterium]